MKRESFVFYRSFYEAINELPEETQLEVYKAITSYALEGELTELAGLPKVIFTLIKPQLDANNKKYLDGKKGGRPPKQEKTLGYEDKKPMVY